MQLTPSGMVTDFKLVQPEKAPQPMLITLFPMETEVKLLQPEKA